MFGARGAFGMNVPFEPKRAVRLELSAALIERAEALGLDLANAVEAGLATQVRNAELRPANEPSDAEARCRAANAFLDEHGFWGEEHSIV
jgi:post-segregation antitoxin (ccd killing protein)